MSSFWFSSRSSSSFKSAAEKQEKQELMHSNYVYMISQRNFYIWKCVSNSWTGWTISSVNILTWFLSSTPAVLHLILVKMKHSIKLLERQSFWLSVFSFIKCLTVKLLWIVYMAEKSVFSCRNQVSSVTFDPTWPCEQCPSWFQKTEDQWSPRPLLLLWRSRAKIKPQHHVTHEEQIKHLIYKQPSWSTQ